VSHPVLHSNHKNQTVTLIAILLIYVTTSGQKSENVADIAAQNTSKTNHHFAATCQHRLTL